MRDALEGIGKAMGEVVHWIDAPLAPGAGVRYVADPIDDRVAHGENWRGHVDLRAQDYAAGGELARLHALEEIEVLVDGAVPVGARRARLGERAAARGDLLRGEVADEGGTAPDQLERALVETREVVRSEVEPVDM